MHNKNWSVCCVFIFRMLEVFNVLYFCLSTFVMIVLQIIHTPQSQILNPFFPNQDCTKILNAIKKCVSYGFKRCVGFIRRRQVSFLLTTRVAINAKAHDHCCQHPHCNTCGFPKGVSEQIGTVPGRVWAPRNLWYVGQSRLFKGRHRRKI